MNWRRKNLRLVDPQNPRPRLGVDASDSLEDPFLPRSVQQQALAFLDATVRLIPGAIDAESAASESWTGDELDHPAYTRPPRFRGVDVPAVLLSGDHAKIAEWRREQSRARATARNRAPLPG